MHEADDVEEDQPRLAGHDIEEASDGAEALMKVGQERPDIVVLDTVIGVELFVQADASMYRAKRLGKNRVVLYKEDTKS